VNGPFTNALPYKGMGEECQAEPGLTRMESRVADTGLGGRKAQGHMQGTLHFSVRNKTT
jgi:hypothetical protein